MNDAGYRMQDAGGYAFSYTLPRGNRDYTPILTYFGFVGESEANLISCIQPADLITYLLAIVPNQGGRERTRFLA